MLLSYIGETGQKEGNLGKTDMAFCYTYGLVFGKIWLQVIVKAYACYKNASVLK